MEAQRLNFVEILAHLPALSACKPCRNKHLPTPVDSKGFEFSGTKLNSMHISVTRTVYKGKEHACTVLREIFVDSQGRRQRRSRSSDAFEYERDERSIQADSDLDGIYIVRTSLVAEKLGVEDCVRGYKSLCTVERTFRTLKAGHLQVRPTHHRLADRVRAPAAVHAWPPMSSGTCARRGGC